MYPMRYATMMKNTVSRVFITGSDLPASCHFHVAHRLPIARFSLAIRYDWSSVGAFATSQRSHATMGIVPDVFRADCRIGHGGAGVCLRCNTPCIHNRVCTHATRARVCVHALRISHSEAKRHVHRMHASSMVARPMVAR